jgi:hypothetical protein
MFADAADRDHSTTLPKPPLSLPTDQETPALEEAASGPVPLNLEADYAPLKELTGTEEAQAAVEDPYLRDSLLAQEAFDRATAAVLAGDEPEAVKQYLLASKRAENAHEWYLAAVSCQRVGDFLCNPKPPTDLERAFRMYYRAVAAYQNCGLFAEARRLAYHLMITKMRRARQLHLHWVIRCELVLFWLFAGFGHRPLRVIGAACTIIVLHGFAFWALGGVVMPGQSEPANLGECLYFSGITFTTVGYGDFIPAPPLRFLALIESILGAFTMGFFVVVVGNRLRQ